MDHPALHVQQAGAQHRVGDDRRPAHRLPEPDVTRGVPGQVQHLDRQVRPQPDGLPAAQRQIDRDIRSQRPPQPRLRPGVVVHRRAVGLVPAVALSEDAFAAGHPRGVQRMREHDSPRRGRHDPGSATEVVDIGVRDEDVGEIGRVHPHPAQVGQDDLIRGRDHPGIDQERPLVPQQILGKRPRSQDAFDPVNPRSDLHGASSLRCRAGS